ncbi:hypothetical protein IFM89_019148 [Coptis chinensis]|uniref:BED-type domain-containing protein n=1 Tax=Coptis chinensis TaxID=261450 RepID=A0A835LEV7_9MAGN|nr:hypothetical protein IFM89_019148 [Coptis chinensis]
MSSLRAPAAEGGAGDDKLILSPLWNHVEKISKAPSGGGNYKVRCKFCSKIWSGSYSRVKKHFLGEGGFGVKECTGDPQTPKIFKASMKMLLNARLYVECKLNRLRFHYRKFTMERSQSVSYMLALKA